MSAAGPELDLLTSIETGQAPRRILEFAARGFVPLPPGELVRAVATILSMGDAELSTLAEETFRGFDVKALVEAVASPGVKPNQLDAVARRTPEQKVLEPLIRHRSVTNETLAWLAERVPAELQDVLVTNQARLLDAPVIVERLFENPLLSTDIRRRADEFLEEFFLKRERELAATTPDALSAEEQAEAADVPEVASVAAEDTLSEDDGRSLQAKLSTLSIVQKIRLAYRGNKEERMFLIRDTNRLVSVAVLKSPKTRDADAEAIAKMKNVSEDVLRNISFKKQWMKKYSIMSALVKNPRAPIDVTLALVKRLNEKDQKLLSTDKNVPEAVRLTCKREVQRKQQESAWTAGFDLQGV